MGKKPTVSRYARTLEEDIREHDRRITVLEASQQELADVVKKLQSDSSEIVRMGKEFIPVVKKMMYFLAIVGATYLLGGDLALIDKVVTLAERVSEIKVVGL